MEYPQGKPEEKRSKDTFWMVWCPERGRPTVQHATRQEAVDEATRVADRENKLVFVLQCIGKAERQPQPVNYTPIGGRE